MAQLLQDEADTSSDASSLYDEIEPLALAQLAAGNADARTQFLALLERCADAERQAAQAQDAIAAMALSVAEVGTAHAPARAIAQTASKRGAAHARTADAIAAAAAACAAMTGDEPTLDANDADAAVDAARRRLRGRGTKHEDRRVALRDAYRQRDASREVAARGCHRTDAKRARAVAAAVTALQRAERAHLAERLSAVVAADDHTATARAKRRAFAATRSSAAGARRHDAALRVLDWCDARRAERRDDVAQAPPAKAAKAVEALFDASSKVTATEYDVAAASTVYGRARRDTLAAIGAHRSTPSVESPLVAECLARLFANSVDAKDARDAAQAMALAATFCADGASTPLVEGAVFRAVWKSTRAPGAPDNSSLSHFSAMTRPSTRRKLIFTQVPRRGAGGHQSCRERRLLGRAAADGRRVRAAPDAVVRGGRVGPRAGTKGCRRRRRPRPDGALQPPRGDGALDAVAG